MLPLKEGIVSEVPGNNLSFKRGRWLGEGSFWKENFGRHIGAGRFRRRDSLSTRYPLWSFSIEDHSNSVATWYIGSIMDVALRNAHPTVESDIAHPLSVRFAPVTDPHLCSNFQSCNTERSLSRSFFCLRPYHYFCRPRWALGEFVGYLSGTGTSCRYVR